MKLSFADQSTKKPRGLLEDVVSVQGYDFSVDFIVLDMECSGRLNQMPIILGRPFLATARIVKSYDARKIQMKYNDEEIEVPIHNKNLKANEIGTIYEINVDEDVPFMTFEEECVFLSKDPLEAALTLDHDALEDYQNELFRELDETIEEAKYMSEYEDLFTVDVEDTRDEPSLESYQMTTIPMVDTQIDYILTYNSGPSHSVHSQEDPT